MAAARAAVSSSSKNISYFADSRDVAARRPCATRRGSQHTWRSFVSAPRIGIVDAARPFLRMTLRTSACAATRMLS